MSRLFVIGAGGHGRIVAEAVIEIGEWTDIAFLDDLFPELVDVEGYPVVGRVDQLPELAGPASTVVAAIGDNVMRLQLIERAMLNGYSCPSIVHPSAYVSRGAQLGAGTVVLANAVIGVGATLGRGCIANTGCTIDHDCRVADGVHISPGANLAGAVEVGRFSWVGIGATINQSLTIGENVVVGASAAVIDNVPACVTCVGVPARIIDS